MAINFKVHSSQSIQMNVLPKRLLDFSISSAGGTKVEHYTGPCSVTPAAEAQVLNTEGYIVDENIVIAPIPSNYGLITYNGFEITVS